MPSDAVAVAEALLDIGGVGFRVQVPITFKSGIVSPVYCDNRTFPFWPAAWTRVIEGFRRLLQEEPIAFDIIGGIEAAGIPHSAALGYALQQPSIFIRKQPKEHGKKARIEGGDVLGKRVVLVEDLVTTGASSLSGVQALRDAGAAVTDCLAIISYGFPEAVQAFQDAGVTLHTLTSFEHVLQGALHRGMLTQSDAAAVRDWLGDPHGWPRDAVRDERRLPCPSQAGRPHARGEFPALRRPGSGPHKDAPHQVLQPPQPGRRFLLPRDRRHRGVRLRL